MPTDKKKPKYKDGTDALKALQRKWGAKDDGKYGPGTARAGLEYSMKQPGGWSTDAPVPSDLPQSPEESQVNNVAKKELYKTGSQNSLARSLYKPKGEIAHFKSATTTPLSDNSNTSINFTPSNAFSDVDINGKDVRPVAASSASTPKVEGKARKSYDYKGALKQTGKYAPTIYNIAAGLGGSEKENRRFYTPQMEKITDMSAPAIKANTEATVASNSVARNNSGGNAGSLRSNLTSNYNNKMKANSDVYMRENLRQTEVANRNLERGNEAKKINMDLATKYDEMDKMNKAKKSEAIARGLEGVSGIIQNEELMDNQKANIDSMKKLIESGYNYRLDGTYKAKKGLKAVKTYKKGTKSVKVYNKKK